MKLSKEFMEEESKRCDNYLGETFRDNLVEVFRQEMLIEPIQILLQKETALDYLFKNGCKEDLKLTFELYKTKEKQLQLFATAFTQYVTQKGMLLI